VVVPKELYCRTGCGQGAHLLCGLGSHLLVSGLNRPLLHQGVHFCGHPEVVDAGLSRLGGRCDRWWERPLDVLHDPVEIVLAHVLVSRHALNVVLEASLLQELALITLHLVLHLGLHPLEQGVIYGSGGEILQAHTKDSMLGVLVLVGQIEDLLVVGLAPQAGDTHL